MGVVFFLYLFPKISSPSPIIFPYRGIYIYPFAVGKIGEYLSYIRKSEINCIVVDFKTPEGYVTYNTKFELVKKVKSNLPIINLEKLIKLCEEEGLLLIGRIVVFQDSILAFYSNGKYSLKTLDGKIWKDGHNLYWVDPCSPFVHKYVIGIAKDLVSRGVKEIQFDYIRFPSTTGNFTPYKKRCKNKTQALVTFLQKANSELKPLGARVTADLFGCVLWIDVLKAEAQSLRRMAPFLDVVHPMLYPSHFPPKYEYHANPRVREYNIILNSLRRGKNLLGEVRFAPYIQGFKWRAPNFGPNYIINQIKAVQSGPAWGYIIWNAKSDYSCLWEVLRREGKLSFGRRLSKLEIKVRKVVNEKIRPVIEKEGGEIEVVRVSKDTLELRLGGGCRRSLLEYYHYWNWVKEEVKKNIKEIKYVIEGGGR